MYSGKGQVQSRVTVLELGVCHKTRRESMESKLGGLTCIYISGLATQLTQGVNRWIINAVTVVKSVVILPYSLWVRSPLSDARKQQRAKRSGSKGSGDKVQRKWACLDLCTFLHFCFASVKWNTIARKGIKRRENCQSVILDEERLDPHGISN